VSKGRTFANRYRRSGLIYVGEVFAMLYAFVDWLVDDEPPQTARPYMGADGARHPSPSRPDPLAAVASETVDGA
jgi:hypothetical protein